MVIFSGKDDSYSHGVAVILDKDSSRTLIGYSPVSDRILKVRIHAKPFNISIVQCYAPTINANDEEMESFYDSLQETVNTIPSRDVKFIIGDLNAKVGKIVTPNTTCGKFGLGEQNERGERLIESCSTNNMLLTNTMFQHHPRHLYTWTSPDRKTRNHIDFIIMSQKWKGCVKNVRTRPGADCNSDHQLLVADIKLRLKKMIQPLQPRRFDYQTLDNNYKIKISKRLEALLQCDEERTPDELWKEGQDIMLSVAEETICKKKKKINRWISGEILKEVEKRRYIKAKGIRDTV